MKERVCVTRKIKDEVVKNSQDVSNLVGKTFKDIYKFEGEIYSSFNDGLLFVTDEGEEYVMTHYQDCCEDVYIEDIEGDLDDLIGTPILKSEKVQNDQVEGPNGDTHTWTFYKFATAKGYVTIRWYGESNGYYSEEVELYKI